VTTEKVLKFISHKNYYNRKVDWMKEKSDSKWEDLGRFEVNHRLAGL
jgi:hypothetical protein